MADLRLKVMVKGPFDGGNEFIGCFLVGKGIDINSECFCV
jgi:hypothetical protein